LTLYYLTSNLHHNPMSYDLMIFISSCHLLTMILQFSSQFDSIHCWWYGLY